MNSSFLALGTALWLGILTSISPCPLATNIAAISFIGRRVDSSGRVIWSGLLYMLGRALAYSVVGFVIATSLLSIPDLSHALQKYMNKILGPLLILVGMLLLELLSIKIPGINPDSKMQQRIGRLGLWGAAPLGFLFALAFCPVSAALFFGTLIPLAIKNNSELVLPSIFGVGSALPVMVFAIALAAGIQTAGKLFERTTLLDTWARRITGILFILIGVYFSFRYIFNLF